MVRVIQPGLVRQMALKIHCKLRLWANNIYQAYVGLCPNTTMGGRWGGSYLLNVLKGIGDFCQNLDKHKKHVVGVMRASLEFGWVFCIAIGPQMNDY